MQYEKPRVGASRQASSCGYHDSPETSQNPRFLGSVNRERLLEGFQECVIAEETIFLLEDKEEGRGRHGVLNTT
jgi:hypothetical protein